MVRFLQFSVRFCHDLIRFKVSCDRNIVACERPAAQQIIFISLAEYQKMGSPESLDSPAGPFSIRSISYIGNWRQFPDLSPPLRFAVV